MNELLEKTDRAVDLVNLNGADVKRILLRTGQKFYRSAIYMYLLDKILARAEALIERPGAFARRCLCSCGRGRLRRAVGRHRRPDDAAAPARRTSVRPSSKAVLPTWTA